MVPCRLSALRMVTLVMLSHDGGFFKVEVRWDNSALVAFEGGFDLVDFFIGDDSRHGGSFSTQASSNSARAQCIQRNGSVETQSGGVQQAI